MWNVIERLLNVAKTPEPKHLLSDKKMKGWYRFCTERKVCDGGTKIVAATLKLFSHKPLFRYSPYQFEGYTQDEQISVNFENLETATNTLERLKRMVPVMEELVARMKAESL